MATFTQVSKYFLCFVLNFLTIVPPLIDHTATDEQPHTDSGTDSGWMGD